MFERRLKIFLGLVFGVTSVLLLRAVQLQVFARSHWQAEAAEFAKRPQLVETTRGRILDCKGKEIAIDEPCMDACVDYRAVRLDPKWLEDLAIRRIKRDRADDYRRADELRRKSMVEREIEAIKGLIDEMWQVLAREGNRTPEQIEEVRRAIQQRVAMRARLVQYLKFKAAAEDHAEHGPSPWYRKWLIEGGADGPSVDDFEQTVGEQVEAHPVLRNISDAAVSRLAKLTTKYPGLSLRPGTRRKYPYGKAGCHIVGQLSVVERKDLDT